MVFTWATTMAGEARMAGELAQLMADPVFRGKGLPRGDGRPVLVLPGLFANDLYLQPMRTWLRRIGYQPVASTLRFNAGCSERLSRQVEQHLRDGLSREDQPVSLIGHSRGGLLAKALAVRLRAQASHVVFLGSPVGGIERIDVSRIKSIDEMPLDNSVARAGIFVRRMLEPECEFPTCGCPFPEDLQAPLNEATKVLSVYAKGDPIVDERACIYPGGQNMSVSGSHSGLAYNVAAYRAIAEFLAATPNE
jgi:pimeloyl-ACP methyl ester carboxylesterase